MEYKEINEEFDNWRGSWQDSQLICKITEKQRERDFREGYMRGFEMGQRNIEKIPGVIRRVEVIQHSAPHNGRAYTNYSAKDVEIQYQDGGTTLKVFCK